MKLKKLPEQISNFDEIITKGFAYIDKTKFIEKIEDNFKVPLFLRPRRFGKTLFTDLLAQYYDINSGDNFETLFGNTYIGKNPTPYRNSYYILRLDFSGINAKDIETSFFNKVLKSIRSFCSKYRDLHITIDQNAGNAAALIDSFFSSFAEARPRDRDRIFIIIDEYDNFANDILASNVTQFQEMTSADGFVKNFYASLKAEANSNNSAVGRFFITGVSSIMISSVTSGFDSKNISDLPEFNEMAGFTEEELRTLIRETLDLSLYEGRFTENDLLRRMKLCFDGYLFSETGRHHLFNPSMCINYLNTVKSLGCMTNQYDDPNIDLDVSKFSKLMELINERDRMVITRRMALADDTGKNYLALNSLRKNLNINIGVPFSLAEGVSMLYYLGYLTLNSSESGIVVFRIPNLCYRKLFTRYYLSVFFNDGILSEADESLPDLETTADIRPLISGMSEIISGIIPANEKDVTERAIVSIAGTLILSNLQNSEITTEYEIRHHGVRTRDRADLVILNSNEQRPSYLIEFKYRRETAEHDAATKARNIAAAKQEAREQLAKYLTDDRLKETPNLHKFIIVYAYGELVWEEWNASGG